MKGDTFWGYSEISEFLFLLRNPLEDHLYPLKCFMEIGWINKYKDS